MNRAARLAAKQAALDAYLTDLTNLTKLIRDGTLAELLLRDEHGAVPDGYPSAVLGGPHGTDVSRPVETIVIAREEHHTTDHTHHAIEQAIFALRRAADESRTVIAWMNQATRHVDTARGRNPDRHDGSGDCNACDRPCSGAHNDRLRSGYCEACYRRWVRNDRPDRAAFERNTPHWEQPEQEAG